MSEISPAADVEGFVRSEDPEALGEGVAGEGGRPTTVTPPESESSMISPAGKGSSPSCSDGRAEGEAAPDAREPEGGGKTGAKTGAKTGGKPGKDSGADDDDGGLTAGAGGGGASGKAPGGGTTHSGSNSARLDPLSP